jgi:NAD+ synthase (glutamine-hydrolysing)
MKLIRVGAAVLNQTPLDWDGNRARIVAAIESARAAGVSALCLPELCITGYGCEDAFHSPGVHAMALEVLSEILPHTRDMIVSLGLPLLHGGALFNTACMAVDGKIVGFVAKQNLAGEGLHYEPRWFKAWPENTRTTVDVLGGEYPLGDVVFDCGGVRYGFEICEDAWVAKRPGAHLARLGIDILLNPSASHFAFGKREIRKRFVVEGSRAFNVGYIYANLLGNEAGRSIYDGDAMIAAAGKLLALGPRFSYSDHYVTSALIDIDTLRMSRSRISSYRPQLDADAGAIVETPFEYPVLKPERVVIEHEAWESSPDIKEEEFARAVSLALFDYLRKSRSHGFVVSLSGGADSAACSLLAARMVDFGWAGIGREAWLKKLSYIPGLAELTDPKEVVRRLLTCAYQATRNSGDVTRNAARSVAQGLGAEYLEFDIDSVVQQYISIVSNAIGRPLKWDTDDLALQNIQARVRSPSVWLLANLRNALLLSTSNRSEAAVGYATMDGDTSGGLAPIAGIDKAFLRHWLRWMETKGPHGLGPFAALAPVNNQQPTAELRPPSAKQTDEEDLMPYDVLDAIERAFIRDKRSPRDVLQVLEVDFKQYDRLQLVAWIERFFKLWCRNQWKRERYAPCFHLDDENLDPKTWCRFPILSGGYQRELAELRALVEAGKL